MHNDKNSPTNTSIEMDTFTVISLPQYKDPLLIQPTQHKETNIIIHRIYPLIIVLLFIIIVTIYTNYNSKDTIKQCIIDHVHLYTNNINAYFHYHSIPRYLMMSISSLCIDFIFIFALFDWAINFISMRLIICWFMFYAIRGIIQFLYQMPFPEGYFWGNPYFPSIIVSDLDTSDFFFSGHVAMPLMTGLHYLKINFKFTCFCFVTVFIEMFLVITTRVHYGIDVVIGLLFAHYVFINVNMYIEKIDRLFKIKRRI